MPDAEVCEECGSSDLHTDTASTLLSYPPKWAVTCGACSHVAYRVDDVAGGFGMEFSIL